MTDWYPEGGFYETRARQGESVWEDDANFDPPVPTSTEDMRTVSGKTGAQLSFSDLTREESYDFKPTIYGS